MPLSIIRRLEEIRLELASLALQLSHQEQTNEECKSSAPFLDVTVLHEQPRIDLISRFPGKAAEAPFPEVSPGNTVDKQPPLVIGDR